MIELPRRTLSDDDIEEYVKILKIPYFRGVKMRDELPSEPRVYECGVLNLNTHTQKGSHWTCWYKQRKKRLYFDSFGEPPPIELLQYLKSQTELEEDLPAVKCNAITVQHDQSTECGSLCLYVLKQLSIGISFADIIVFLETRYRNPSNLILSIR